VTADTTAAGGSARGSPAATFAPLQQCVADHEQREAAMPKNTSSQRPVSGPAPSRLVRETKPGKASICGTAVERGEEISARQDEDGAQSRSLESDEQETGRHQQSSPNIASEIGMKASMRGKGTRVNGTSAQNPTKGRDDDSQRTALCIERRGCDGQEGIRALRCTEIAHITDPDYRKPATSGLRRPMRRRNRAAIRYFGECAMIARAGSLTISPVRWDSG